MGLRDLHILPKFRDGWSYLYVEHCKVDQDNKAIAVHDARGKVPVPCASLSLLMLGPGTSITHAAIRTLAQNGCLVMWTGEEGVRFYAQGMGETRKAYRLIHQARLASSPPLRLTVVRRLYQMRFDEPLDPGLTLREIRGKEGIRVRQAYALASRETGVPWKGRRYKGGDWYSADPVNRALSAANSCLYGICHAAIVSMGYSPALGFIHTGRMLSFVYDIADLYKTDISIPLAFRVTAEGEDRLESRVRRRCRDLFKERNLLARIASDIDRVLDLRTEARPDSVDPDSDPALPGDLWDPEEGTVAGGVSYGKADGGGEPGGGDNT
ncbi:MAG TPA: type I-E CRISPR-associated endonuclease Cas1 [Clostridiales bacterium]|nr:type I-E CRISPR-associated endonuclease Cas1 [Clostridiales bacterium]